MTSTVSATTDVCTKQNNSRDGNIFHIEKWQINSVERRVLSLMLGTISCGVGEMVAKPAWGKDQPNNYNGEQNCVVLDGGRNWQWNDVGCNLDYLHWICQHSKWFALFS